MPRTTATPGTAPSGMPVAVSGPVSSWASAGSASMPTTSEVMVMPSWVPESWKESSRRASTTVRARRSPAAAARSASGRSTVTRPNSAATKNPLARISRKCRCRAAAGGWSCRRLHGRMEGRRRYYRTIRPLLEGVTPRVAGWPRGPVRPRVAGRGARERLRHQSNQRRAPLQRAGRGPAAVGPYPRRPAWSFRPRARRRAGVARWPAAWRCRAGCPGRAGWCRR